MVRLKPKSISPREAAEVLVQENLREIETLQAENERLRKRFDIPAEGKRPPLKVVVDQILRGANGSPVLISDIESRIEGSDTKPKGKCDDGAIRKCFSENQEEMGWGKTLVGGSVAYTAPVSVAGSDRMRTTASTN